MSTVFTSNYNGGYGSYYEFKAEATETKSSDYVTTNQSTVTVNIYMRRINVSSNGAYNLDGTAWSISINGTTTTGSHSWDTRNSSDWKWLGSASKVITHNDDGTAIVSIVASHTGNSASGASRMGNSSGSGTFELETIPRASSISASDGTLGTVQTLTINRASTSFEHSIVYSCGSLTNQTAGLSASSGIGGSCTFTPPLSLASQNTVGESVSVTFTITTFNGSTNIGSKIMTIICSIPSSVKPSCDFTYSDTTSCFSTYGKFVQNRSALSISVSSTLAYGSQIKSYSVQVDGKTYTSQNVTTGILVGTGTKNIVVSVTDNRNRTSVAVSKQINILEYSAPVVTLTANRCTSAGTVDQEGAYMKLSITGQISSLDNQNSATYEIKYKKSSDQSWTTLSGSGTSYTSNVIACDVSKVWNVECTITDELSNTIKVTNIPIAFVLMDFYSSGKGIAFGKVAEQDGFDCDMIALFKKNTYFTGDVTFLGDVDFSGLMDDYVVAQGTSGNWTYRKWNSGVLEQWAIITPTFASWSTWGNNYWYQSSETTFSFGVSFVSGNQPIVTVNNWSNSWAIPFVQSVTNAQFNLYGVRPTAGVTTANAYYFSIYAIGKWK